MKWFRTVRFDVPHSSDAAARVASELRTLGVGVRFAIPYDDRRYALLEGTTARERAELETILGNATLFNGTVIAIAIEPWHADALPFLAQAFSAPGSLAGILGSTKTSRDFVVELDPVRTRPSTFFTLLDVELRRFGSSARRTRQLAPLPVEVLAQCAADGLHCPEIAPDRILEALLADVSD